ncbi:MAG TPA: PsbP-related protein [Acidimicrobiia bacterium]|nr:PsbP-related protein [Acidimicrobiia bacterium]
MRLFTLGLVVALAACAPSTAETTTSQPGTTTVAQDPFDPDDLTLYESPTYGFAVAYPEDWTVSEVGAENLIGFTAPSTGATLTPNFNVTVNEVSPDFPPIAYYEGEIERVTTALENAEILEAVNVNVNGVIGRGLTIVTRQSGVDIGISRMIVINDDRAYELSFFAEASELDRLSDMVAAIIQSFRFLE